MQKTVLFGILLLGCLFQATAVFADETWNLHFQATAIPQWHPPFDSPYAGLNSLSGDPELATSFTTTLFLGARVWKGGEIYFDPEVSAGMGLSSTHGVAGFPNAEIYRVSSPTPMFNPARLFVRQVFGLGGKPEAIESAQNQLGSTLDTRRLSVVFGKFSLNDFFDQNTYAHDPRNQFLNWAFMDNGAWDYAADTRGYTWGIYAEYHEELWSLRLAIALMPLVANGSEFDLDIGQARGQNIELERRYQWSGKAGAIRALAYLNNARMGSYAQVLSNPAYNLDITQTRDYRSKFGFGLNWEQALSADAGLFSRLGWNDGSTESFVFTEIDRTFSFGTEIKGSLWGRPEDRVGAGAIVNGLSDDHMAYLAAGGYGFIIGDGRLNYAPEEILELYYSIATVKGLSLTADYQFVNHPAYNADRGPVSIGAVRFHYEI